MADVDALLKTPLYDLHVQNGAKMVPFAGYAMPVQYPLGILKEHLHTRAAAGLFDVSHMGQVSVHGAERAERLEALVPVDVLDLPAGKQRYALFTNEQGGILDDLMISNAGDHLFLVVNAACKHTDVAHLQQHMTGCEVMLLEDRALLALQGPAAVAVMQRVCADAAQMAFMDNVETAVADIDCRVSRSGYTGEDGYEIGVPGTRAAELAERLLQESEVALIGLGARDSLRLEAGLCLYGHDMGDHTTPVEASLGWAISKARRTDGARAGGFPGASRVLAQMRGGAAHRRVGIQPEGRAPLREHVVLYAATGEPVGQVTSGGFGPSVERPVAMGYVNAAQAVVGTTLQAEVRGKRLPAEVVKLPFTPHRFHRG
jgi:aminomethyltransferase